MAVEESGKFGQYHVADLLVSFYRKKERKKKGSTLNWTLSLEGYISQGAFNGRRNILKRS